jgi:hypothetical protein
MTNCVIWCKSAAVFVGNTQTGTFVALQVSKRTPQVLPMSVEKLQGFSARPFSV